MISNDPLPIVRAEQYPLTLLFQNLIGNAIKYARRGTIPRIRVSAQQDTTVCQFSVADNGIGIEAQDIAAIFAPFKRLHASEYPGTGLGLAMCQRIVERYQGTYLGGVCSRPGFNLSFHFARRGWFLVRPAEIVIIEDNQADMFLVKVALEEYAIQYALTWFRNGLEAVLALCAPVARENTPCPDIILLDLNTPRSDGFEILAKLQHTPRLAGAQIAILTSSRTLADHARAA